GSPLRADPGPVAARDRHPQGGLADQHVAATVRSPDARLPRELRRGAPGDRAGLPLPVRPVAASLATGDTLQSRVARCTLPQAKCASSATSLRLDRERIGVEVERELLA